MTTHIWINEWGMNRQWPSLLAIDYEQWRKAAIFHTVFICSAWSMKFKSFLIQNDELFRHLNRIKSCTTQKLWIQLYKKSEEFVRMPCLWWIWNAILFWHEYMDSICCFQWVCLCLRACQMLMSVVTTSMRTNPTNYANSRSHTNTSTKHAHNVYQYSLSVPPIICTRFGWCFLCEWENFSHRVVYIIIKWYIHGKHNICSTVLIPLRLINNALLLLLFYGQLTKFVSFGVFTFRFAGIEFDSSIQHSCFFFWLFLFPLHSQRSLSILQIKWWSLEELRPAQSVD